MDLNFASVLSQFSLFQGFLQGVNPTLASSCESSLFPDLSPSSVVTFDNKQFIDKVPAKFAGSDDLDEASVGSVEAEIVMNSLRHALTQVLQSTDVDHQSKKLIDASMSIIVDDFLVLGKPQEQDHIAELISAKSHVLSICLFLWIIVFALAFFFGSGVESSFNGPLPT